MRSWGVRSHAPSGRVAGLPGAPAGERVYRPRHPERMPLYRLIERGFEGYRRVYAERFEPEAGPWREPVERAVHAFLDCGRLQGGFARIRCPSCGGEHLLAFSCRTRNLCPSCQAKRSTLFGAWLAEHVLLDVAHRHVVATIPKRLRGLLERDRALHGLMARVAWEVLERALVEATVEPRGHAGGVIALQTFGSYGANFHPHLHGIVTEGVITPDGLFHPAVWPDEGLLAERFRRRFLLSLERAGRLRRETRERFLAWRHAGFSLRATQRVPAGATEQAERLARYATRVVVASERIESVGAGRVRITTPPDPVTQATVVELDEIELVHRLCQHIPPPRMHMTRHYGAYANRLRRSIRRARAALTEIGLAPPVEEVSPPAEGVSQGVSPRSATLPGEPLADAAEALRRRSWARLLRKVFEVDPLLCPRCGETMVVVAVITDWVIVDRIARHVRERELASVHEEASARDPPGSASGPKT